MRMSVNINVPNVDRIPNHVPINEKQTGASIIDDEHDTPIGYGYDPKVQH